MALLVLNGGEEDTFMETAIFSGLLVLATVIAGRVGWVCFQTRGDRLVTCPETRQPAGVTLDIKQALRHSALPGIGGAKALRLHTCSRWPERQGCGQECLAQIEASPESCLVRTVLTRWYAEKSCAVCGKPIGEIHWAYHRPALMNAERRTVEWTQLRAEMVPAVLETHSPVCWNCHIMQTFCHEHPDMVVDRNRSSRM
jgi:hypothetical protein